MSEVDVAAQDSEGAPRLRPLPAESAVLTSDQGPDEGAVTGTGNQPLPAGHRPFMWQVHAYTNTYIRFSDTKAGVAIAFDLAGLGALYGSGPLRAVASAPPGGWTPLQWATAGASVLLLASALAAAWSIRPRLRNPQLRGFIFWESVRAHASAAAFYTALSMQKDADLDRHLAEHLHVLAGIASQKYFWSACSLILSMVGGALAGLAILFS